MEMINLNELGGEFPFKWRVQSFSKGKPMAICVPYCDARQVADQLDRVCGAENWQNEYYNLDGKIYCKIGIKIDSEWIWKSDCGSESNIEAEKGEASDAFKRAGVKWRIGRFLYDMRPYTLKANKKKETGDKPWHCFAVDDKDRQIPDWAITDFINGKRGSKHPVPAANSVTKSESAMELEALEEWAGKYTEGSIQRALSWMGIELSPADFKREGLANLPREKYALFCHLVKLTRYESDLLDMCLEGFEFVDMQAVIKAGCVEKILDECKKIKAQTPDA